MINEIKVLSDGFVRYVDHMGNDSSVVQAARVSYGAGTKSVSDDSSLIRFLMRHRHTTPFEMVEFKFHVRVPMDTWRQWVRHRTASINEYSTRYSEAIDSQDLTNENEWRLQSSSNKQGSGDYINNDHMKDALNEINGFIENTVNITDSYNHLGEYLTQIEASLLKTSKEVYAERLKYGVAREQARKDLPLSTYTEAYWKVNLHNLFHFLSLRMDSHAQYEIRQYANAIGQIVSQYIPISWQAFLDYRLNSIHLSAIEIQALQELLAGKDLNLDIININNKREKEEFISKIKRITHKD